jgi:transcriptional regulatory protein LEU3
MSESPSGPGPPCPVARPRPADPLPLQLRCDVQQDPFVSCSRCRKHKLNCIIEANFKRVGKRSRHAEMEREITALRAQISQITGQQPPPAISTPTQFVGAASLPENTGYPAFSNEDEHFLGSQQAVQSLLDLRGGSPSANRIATLGSVMLAPDRVTELFQEFFANYHPYLPFLDPADPPEEYLKADRLLFWAIITTAARHFRPDPTLYGKLAGTGGPLMDLLWSTLRKVPQSHQVVKALCFLCTWPLSTTRTSTDPTFMLCGLMMQIALQIGLHQPTHLQDFARFKLTLKKEDINDRVRTWAVCNIVAQMYAFRTPFRPG